VASYGAQEAYRVVPARTHPRLSLGYFGYSVPLAKFTRSSGRVLFDRKMRTASADVVLETESIDTGYPAIDRLLRGDEFLHVERFPTAIFRSSQVAFVGERPVSIDGTLTLKGATRPVRLVVQSFKRLPPSSRKKETLVVSAVANVRRSDFGVGWVIPNVGDEIRVDIEIEVEKE
jgi:polyisoprenoid-binding protein YceI